MGPIDFDFEELGWMGVLAFVILVIMIGSYLIYSEIKGDKSREQFCLGISDTPAEYRDCVK